MPKTRILERVDAIMASAFVLLLFGAGVFCAVLLARTSRHASAWGKSALDISKTDLQGQESPKNSAMRLNAIWVHEKSQA